MVDVRIDGLAALEKALAELPEKLQRNVVRGGLRAGAKVIEQRAKDAVPVRSGKLRDSIRVSVRVKRGVPEATIRAGGRDKGGAFYAHWVEFGTGAHLIKPKARKSLVVASILRETVDHPGATAHPFMRPAMDAGAQEAVLAFGEYVRKRLTKQGIDTPELIPEETT